MKTIDLTLRETQLLQGAIRTAIGAYRQQLPTATPSFGIDDQPSTTRQPDAQALMAACATMLTITYLETLLSDMGRADKDETLQGSIAITFAVEGDAFDLDSHEMTLALDADPKGLAHLVLLALYQGNAQAGHGHAPTMELLGRLI